MPLAVKAEFAGADFLVEDLTLNLSVGGVFLRTPHAVPLRTRGSLTFRLERWKEPFSVHVEVVHCVPPNDTGQPEGLGLQFLDLTERDFARLQELVSDELSSMREMLDGSAEDLLARLRRCSTGEKVMLAAAATRPEIDALIREGNPVVVRRVLKNPRLGLDGVRRILHSKRMTDAVIAAIASSSKWTADEKTRVLICRHPCARLEDVTTQLNRLPPQHLFELSCDHRLRFEVRERAKRILNARYPQWQSPKPAARTS